ncbi:hypothetical protein FZEAL_2451 [Fusarium zealandicum]|uniref:Uncharacterized protein n=1 Tax=Fusarium zealandicum TaxID=1053134 RepID=A0A8H4XNK7_9HYPO|nr:hypothetical protein FZEAL_2451 [Fusarium zealandicum]
MVSNEFIRAFGSLTWVCKQSDMAAIHFEKSTGVLRELDDAYCRLFTSPLQRKSPDLSYEGYRRALQLYGNESDMASPGDGDLFFIWKLRNPLTIRNFRQRARAEGYDPELGRSSPKQGLYYGRKTTDLQPQQTASQTVADAPQDVASKRRRLDVSDDESAADLKPPRQESTSNNDLGEPPKPKTLRDMSGSRVPLAHDFGRSCVGQCEMGLVLVELLELVAQDPTRDGLMDAVNETLEYTGGSKNFAAFLTMMYEKFPKGEPESVASTVGRQLRG